MEGLPSLQTLCLFTLHYPDTLRAKWVSVFKGESAVGNPPTTDSDVDMPARMYKCLLWPRLLAKVIESALCRA